MQKLVAVNYRAQPQTCPELDKEIDMRDQDIISYIGGYLLRRTRSHPGSDKLIVEHAKDVPQEILGSTPAETLSVEHAIDVPRENSRSTLAEKPSVEHAIQIPRENLRSTPTEQLSVERAK